MVTQWRESEQLVMRGRNKIDNLAPWLYDTVGLLNVTEGSRIRGGNSEPSTACINVATSLKSPPLTGIESDAIDNGSLSYHRRLDSPSTASIILTVSVCVGCR